MTSLERLRETEKTEALNKISALELKVHLCITTCEPAGVLRGELTHLLFRLLCFSLKLKEKASEETQDGEGQANVSATDSLKVQLEGMGFS